MNTDQWASFVDRARTDGKLIEGVIKDLYTTCLPRGAVALDGGANVGFHTTGLARCLVDGRVIAVEANPDTLVTLKRTTAPWANVEVVWGALQADASRQTVQFNCSSSHPGRSGIGRLWDRITPGQVEYRAPADVPATTIDLLVRAQERLDFIKLDLEGGEFPALRGAEQALRRWRPLVVSEHSRHAPALNGFAMEDWFAWLGALGYTAIAPNGAPLTLQAPFPFWYAFLVPQEQLAPWTERIAVSLDRFR